MIDSMPPGSAFAELGLAPPLVRALVDERYEQPTPIQARTIRPALDGRDVLACAQTGTGKTAAFVLPMLQTLAAPSHGARGRARALVLAPTRELAAQIAERTRAYGRHLSLRHALIYGGVSQRGQEDALRRRPDLLIATPGRLLDLLDQGIVSLDDVEILVLDEADRMLDMGFIHDVRRIIARMPRRRQTLFFSATVDAGVRRLSDDILRDPAHVSVAPDAACAPSVRHVVWHVARSDKRVLVQRVLSAGSERRAIVFTRTKRGANRVCDDLVRAGFAAGVIHGNKSQSARDRVMNAFRAGGTRVLVATDVAARGIDVEDVGLVVNYDLPNVAESYVHRIGRTGRAGNEGEAISFCDAEERAMLADIERYLRFRIPVAEGSASVPAAAAPRAAAPPPKRSRWQPNRNHRRGAST